MPVATRFCNFRSVVPTGSLRFGQDKDTPYQPAYQNWFVMLVFSIFFFSIQ